MKKPKQSSNKRGGWVLAVVAALLLLYWGNLLRQSLPAQYGEDPQELAGFVRWLLGYVAVAAALAGLGWLNFKGPFRYLSERRQRRLYQAWMLVLWWLLFELLQWRTDYDPDVVEENLLVSALGWAFTAGFTIVLDAVRARRERVELVQQKTAAELHSLRAQLNPHFLFNALNTLYSEAIQQGQEKLSWLIGELSGILRFSLQQAQQDEVDIAEEITFLQRYIHLQEARLPENPQRRLDFQFNWDERPAQVAPLLLLPFVENAFLYGLHPSRPCFLNLQLDADQQRLVFSIENSIIRPQVHRGAGLGMANSRQRLEHLYPGSHRLKVETSEDVFKVRLEIELR
ncbi:MAG: histidine kinase [Saprospiraceae bacterium]|jgi:hypothetical protein|nr:histidine kinase [Saprospiraceae bacterium]HRD79332.1 histidine kinase [Saprospiraceae bacterium]